MYERTHNGHLLILLHAPPLEEALANFVYGKDQLSAHSTYVEACTGALKVAYCRLCCAAQPREAKILVLGAAPAVPQGEPPHEHADPAPTWCPRTPLESNRGFPEPVCFMVSDAFL
jgi:hypothetical protein